MNQQMMIPWSNVSTAGSDDISIGRFAHFDFAIGIEAASKCCGEAFWHMLDGDYSGTIGRHLFKYTKQRFGPASRSTDGNDLFGFSANGSWGNSEVTGGR